MFTTQTYTLGSLIFALLYPLPTFSTSVQANCLHTTASLELGSGATKLSVARVDKCKKKILKVLQRNSEPVLFQAALDLSGKQKTIDRATQQQAIGAIQKFKEIAATHRVSTMCGIATAAIRNATNKDEVINNIQKNTGITILPVTQAMEAHLGLLATKQQLNIPTNKKLLIWDIGGGSQQLVATDKSFPYLSGNMATEAFKARILSFLSAKGGRGLTSPNPISAENILECISLANKHSGFHEQADLRVRHYMTTQHPLVIGISNVHQAVMNIANPGKNFYTRQHLRDAIEKFSTLTDKELLKISPNHPAFISYEVTNMIMIYALMRKFGIFKVYVKNAMPADVLLLEPCTSLQQRLAQTGKTG